MPEAVLARELGLKYGAVNVVVNWGAGLSDEPITLDKILEELELHMQTVIRLIEAVATTFVAQGLDGE